MARAYLTYDASLDDVRTAVLAAHEGRTLVSADDLTGLLETLQSRESPPLDAPQLSARELEILRLLVAGEPTDEIAQLLGITAPTVRKHVQNILEKLGVHSRLHAAAVAVRAGLV